MRRGRYAAGMDGWGIAGSLGEIVGAAATIAAVVVALIGTKHAREAQAKAETELADERRRRVESDERSRQEQRAAQARKVVMWITDVPASTIGGAPPDQVQVSVVNHSDMFVLGVRTAEPIVGDRLVMVERTLAPGGHQEKVVDEPPQIASGEVTTMRFIRFQDAAGIMWDRFIDGTLREVPHVERSWGVVVSQPTDRP